MNIIEYRNNPKLAIATEIFNAKVNSPDEMLKCIDDIKAEEKEFVEIIQDYDEICLDLEFKKEQLPKKHKELRSLLAFKDSKVGKLIADFIKNNSDELMRKIETEIESSGNPFEIIIHYEDYDWSKGEVYGPTAKRFSIGSVNTFYYFDNWDIDDDIGRFKHYIKNLKIEIESLTNAKKELEDEYGF